MDIAFIISSIGLILLLVLCVFKPYREMFDNFDFSDTVNHYENLRLNGYDNRHLLVFHVWLCLPGLNLVLVGFIILYIIVYIFNKLHSHFSSPKDLRFWSKKDDDLDDFRKLVLSVALMMIVGVIEFILILFDMFIEKVKNWKGKLND